jgi:hypothetical protein
MTYEATGCQTYQPLRREAPTLDHASIRTTPYATDVGPRTAARAMQRIVRSHNDWPLRHMGDWT